MNQERLKPLSVRAIKQIGFADFGALGCSWTWGLDQASEHGEYSSEIVGLVGWYVGWRVARVGQEVSWKGLRCAGKTSRVCWWGGRI